jgi:hypothetical protein
MNAKFVVLSVLPTKSRMTSGGTTKKGSAEYRREQDEEREVP